LKGDENMKKELEKKNNDDFLPQGSYTLSERERERANMQCQGLT
jgi:hypothetical protein